MVINSAAGKTFYLRKSFIFVGLHIFFIIFIFILSKEVYTVKRGGGAKSGREVWPLWSSWKVIDRASRTWSKENSSPDQRAVTNTKKKRRTTKNWEKNETNSKWLFFRHRQKIWLFSDVLYYYVQRILKTRGPVDKWR